MHVDKENKKNEEDQKKAKEMEVSPAFPYRPREHTLTFSKAMHAATEQKKAEEDQRKAKEMEVSPAFPYRSRECTLIFS